MLDDGLLVGTNNAEQQDILETLEKKYRIHSTAFCSQFDVAGWHSKLGRGTLADAIMDRIVSKSQSIKILGDKSMRSR
ncbi:ATP-binding protein [Catenibacterium mitsuokai]|nr:ATP-binding protein [Catenibacterium mitsuokai]